MLEEMRERERERGSGTAGPKSTDEGTHAVDKGIRSEEHTSELQSHLNLVCRLLLEKKKKLTRPHRQERNGDVLSYDKQTVIAQDQHDGSIEARNRHRMFDELLLEPLASIIPT